MKLKNWLCTTLTVVSFAFAGCNVPAEPQAAGSKNEATTSDLSPEMTAKLVAADRLDGEEDQVIGKCYVCGLGMDGKAEHAAEFGGYTAHLCSNMCKEHFAEDPAKVVEATDIPAAKTSPDTPN